MQSQKQRMKALQDPAIASIRTWLIKNGLYDRLKSDIGLIEQQDSMEKCIESFNKCRHYVEYRKLHLGQYLWLRRNNLLKEFQKKIKYSKSDSQSHASKYRGRFSITYSKCIKDWNDGNFKTKSDYYRCFSGNLKYLERNNLLDKFLIEVLTKKLK